MKNKCNADTFSGIGYDVQAMIARALRLDNANDNDNGDDENLNLTNRY